MMEQAAYVLGGLVVAVIASLLANDLYYSLPSIELWFIRLAARRLPADLYDRTQEQWIADLNDLPSSQVWRLLFAIDCVRGAVLIRHRASRVTAKAHAADTIVAGSGGFTSRTLRTRSVSRWTLVITTTVTVGILFFMVGAFIRIVLGPVSLGPLSTNLSKSLTEAFPGVSIKYDQAALEWSRKDSRVQLVLLGVRTVDGGGHIISELPKVDIKLSAEAFLSGALKVKSLTLYCPDLPTSALVPKAMANQTSAQLWHNARCTYPPGWDRAQPLLAKHNKQ